MRNLSILVSGILTCFFAAGPVVALNTSEGRVNIARVVDGLDEPWGVDILPDGQILITERGGRLLLAQPDGTKTEVAGAPRVAASGQGGLLDVTIARDFAESREIFLSYSLRQSDGNGTALAVGRLSRTGGSLEDVRTIFTMDGSNKDNHYGSRVVEARDGTLFMTIGDRGVREEAQNLESYNGTVVRVQRSGEIPTDNPFVKAPDVRPAIYSYGHRNPQGAGLDLNGNLWVAEHGARGGDEVNLVAPGENYGWPTISYGRHYNGRKIGVGTRAPGMMQPEHYWDPSIAPSGLLVYSGKLWPKWKGNIFVGSLKFDYISRLSKGNKLREVEKISGPETGRVRDIIEGPDGSIWFLSVNEGALFRLTPG